MAEKVKVSREVAEALDKLLQQNTKNDVMKFYFAVLDVNIERLVAPESFALRSLEPMQLATMLLNGYEIEETPEERFIDWYKGFCPAIPGDAICMNVIHEMIDILGIKIKGFNE